MNWEQIDAYHERAKVFGGWLVKAYTDVEHIIQDQGMHRGWDFRVAMTFVPDPRHEWVVEK